MNHCERTLTGRLWHTVSRHAGRLLVCLGWWLGAGAGAAVFLGVTVTAAAQVIDQSSAAPPPVDPNADLLERIADTPVPIQPTPGQAEGDGAAGDDAPLVKLPGAVAAPGRPPRGQAAPKHRFALQAIDRLKAIPRKPVLKRHRVELSPLFSLSLSDAFYQHLAVSGMAVFYPHDAFGIGFGVDYFVTHQKSEPLRAVREGQIAVPADFEQPDLFLHIDAYWVPIYGKVSLFDRLIGHFDLYLFAGLGVATALDGRYPPALNVGLGERFYINEWLAVRVEFRQHVYLDRQRVFTQDRSDLQTFSMFSVGMSTYVPFRDGVGP